MLAGENIGEFGKLMANRQSFLPQIYGLQYSVFLFVVHVIQVVQRDVFITIFLP